MRIKKLELFGFKSFKDRTVVHFDAGITGIVGPNGCGKSNIVDALVWVMGEMSAKHLRGSSMEDVIFAGAEGYAPMGMAEVSLTLENDGGPFPAKYARHSEIMVTRRLNRSGESEYQINKEPARLRDIQEIFMDTGAGSKGFSIIEQGAIGKIITAKPEERRVLIEEAAGITKFKVRKRESQRKLTSTDQNLVRLQDIIGEQKRQLDSLQRQAQRAERYRKIKDELKEKELWVSSKKYLSLHAETSEAQSIFTEAKEQEASMSAEISQIESELEQLKLNVSERESEVQQGQSENQVVQDKVKNLESEIRELQFEIEQARRNKEMTGNILEQYTVRREALEKDQKDLSERQQAAASKAGQLEQEFSEKRERFAEVQSRIQSADDELTEKRREMLAVSQSESHMEAKLSGQEAQLADLSERYEQSRAIELELTEKKTEFEQRRNKIFGELEKERQLQFDIVRDVENLTANVESLGSQVTTKQDEVARFKDELNEVASRLYGLENLRDNFEGFQEGVKSVMLWQRQKMEAVQLQGGQPVVEYRPVAEVVEVPAEYELAMEAALGNRLQMLLSSDADAAVSGVDYLKEQKNGRSSFFAGAESNAVSSSETQQSELKGESGVQAMLSDVVRVPEGHERQVAQIIKDIVIVDSIRTALALRPNYSGKTFVTVDGDTLSEDGVLTGGASENADSGMLKRRREIKELSQKREEAAGKLSLAQASLQKLEKQHKALAEQLETAKKQSSEKEILITGLKKDFERAENELNNAQTALNRQQEEVSRHDSQLQVLNEKIVELRETLLEVKEKKQGLERSVEALTEELRQIRQGIDEKQQEVTRLQVESASRRQEAEGLRHQLEMVTKSLNEVETQLGEMSEESQRNTESLSSNQIIIERSKVDLESLIRQAKEQEKKLAQAKDAYEQAVAHLRRREEQVGSSLRGINEYRSRMSEAELKLEQLRMKEQYLLDQINERYMLDLREVAPQYKDQEGDIAATEAELSDLRGKLSRIGEVNLSAIEEYDDLVQRYEFLSQQHKDLMEAKEQLRKVIDRINRICSRRFKETFEQVNERFTKVFPVLFGGGEARLILVEDELKGEMGIDIVSRPPGKKLQNVSLLSGGEKALTAVSLIFAIFLVKPSPYCLLDEVDAPLDDANVFRFNDLVKEMSKRSQIIVVTHNKHTMRVNNKLFGVTMQEKGVSKLVSVSLAEAVKVAEA